ncbi:3-oxoacid CoA-transferase subunit B [Microaerobacter geothermalis]|uniref:3-oxoacid CoA-transferase subunit B n=1 Tax=Microaerobacter geothermalis TaxID=674972 RepID=UPI001F187841|nr:3-oxoacid CoA-transferase subunit B [Microaerobacter geothermalis]MCF6094850.1 3-oxoacid CoA-transferase subunit B [Microaerobacter geothermalis]
MPKKKSPDRIKIAKRLAQELQDRQVVNLGVGIPTLVPDYIEEGKQVFLQSENGLLGMGPTPPEDELDMDLISASKQPITMQSGASLFDSADSFVMIRGGHIDVAVLGALQVDETGEIANWAVPGQQILGVGGAMDLVAGANKIILALTHQSKDGEPKLVKKLTYPSSGIRKANLVVTEKAVFEFKDGIMYLIELDPALTVEELRKITEAEFKVSPTLSVNYK